MSIKADRTRSQQHRSMLGGYRSDYLRLSRPTKPVEVPSASYTSDVADGGTAPQPRVFSTHCGSFGSTQRGDVMNGSTKNSSSLQPFSARDRKRDRTGKSMSVRIDLVG